MSARSSIEELLDPRLDTQESRRAYRKGYCEGAYRRVGSLEGYNVDSHENVEYRFIEGPPCDNLSDKGGGGSGRRFVTEKTVVSHAKDKDLIRICQSRFEQDAQAKQYFGEKDYGNAQAEWERAIESITFFRKMMREEGMAVEDGYPEGYVTDDYEDCYGCGEWRNECRNESSAHELESARYERDLDAMEFRILSNLSLVYQKLDMQDAGIRSADKGLKIAEGMLKHVEPTTNADTRKSGTTKPTDKLFDLYKKTLYRKATALKDRDGNRSAKNDVEMVLEIADRLLEYEEKNATFLSLKRDILKLRQGKKASAKKQRERMKEAVASGTFCNTDRFDRSSSFSNKSASSGNPDSQSSSIFSTDSDNPGDHDATSYPVPLLTMGVPVIRAHITTISSYVTAIKTRVTVIPTTLRTTQQKLIRCKTRCRRDVPRIKDEVLETSRVVLVNSGILAKTIANGVARDLAQNMKVFKRMCKNLWDEYWQDPYEHVRG